MSVGTDEPRLLEAGRLNPGFLKLDLFCHGLRIAPDCVIEGHRGPVRMRSGLGSGLEVWLPGRPQMPVNVPVVEPFAAESPYELTSGSEGDDRYTLTRDGKPVTQVRLSKRPAFQDRLTSSGKPMGSIGVLQGTYLGVYFGPTCANWKRPETEACQFCAVGLNLDTGDEARAKSIEDIVETALAAQAELGITFVHINGGFDDRGGYLARFGPLIEALKRRTGLLIGLQIPPLAEREDYVAFKALGVDNVSFCFELWDPTRFHEVCPGKDQRAGLDLFRSCMRLCAEELGFRTTNGEMILGLEAPAHSCEAVDWITGVGAIPTMCVFRPVIGTALQTESPPQTADLVPIFAHAYRRCMERGLPIGIAPNVRVSIVLTPEEWRWLLPPSERSRYRGHRLRLAALRTGFRTWFRLRQGLRRRSRA